MTHRNLLKKSRALCIPARLGLSLALLITLVGLTPASPAHAGTVYTIDVDNIDDDQSGSGCTLREAIDVANEGRVSGTWYNCKITTGGSMQTYYQINLPATAYTYTLTGASEEDDNASGDLDIAANVVIDGKSPSLTVIDGGGVDRVFDIAPSSGSYRVRIEDVAIQGGSVAAQGGGIRNDGALYITDSHVCSNTTTDHSHHGGGIYNGESAELNITDSEVYSNTTPGASSYGGGIYNDGGTVNISGSSIYNNEAANSFSGCGGIHNAGGTVDIAASDIMSNTANTSGGGLCSLYAGALVTITNSTISNNEAASEGGGGIYNSNSSELTITNCAVFGNEAYNGGGGVSTDGGTSTTVITDSVIYSNTVISSEGVGAGVYDDSGTVIIAGSIISGNHATGSGFEGAGLYNTGGVVTVTQSTISENRAAGGTAKGGGIVNSGAGVIHISHSAILSNTVRHQGAGLYLENLNTVITATNTTISGNRAGGTGGGIYVDSLSTIYLNHATVADNAADSDDNDWGEGGGIYIYNTGTVNFEHTIIAGNLRGTSAIHASADCTGTLNSQGYNLVGHSTGCPSDGTGDQTIDPNDVFTSALGPLADNGGETWTHALLSDSPAIEAIPVGSCSLSADQRGESRPSDGDLDNTSECDIGAYEFTPLQVYLPLALKDF